MKFELKEYCHIKSGDLFPGVFDCFYIVNDDYSYGYLMLENDGWKIDLYKAVSLQDYISIFNLCNDHIEYIKKQNK